MFYPVPGKDSSIPKEKIIRFEDEGKSGLS
jgi:hypothetical protein